MGKICSRCQIDRPLSDFWKRPFNVDGLRGRCIPCCKAGHANWLAKNAERKRVGDQQYYLKNGDKIKRRSSDRYLENKAECKATQKAWRERNAAKLRSDNIRKRQENGEVIREARRQHYRDNAARYKAQSVARQKHIKQATPPWADLKKIEAIYAEAERITKETGILHHVDHFYPLRGKTMCGLHVEGNLRIIPKLDNLRKSNSVPHEVMVTRARSPTGATLEGEGVV